MNGTNNDVCRQIAYKALAAEKTAFEEIEAKWTKDASDIGVTWK